MTELSADGLRALLRLAQPAAALARDLEATLIMETCEGRGDLAVRSYTGLQSAVASIVDDPYLGALTLSVGDAAGDKAKVSAAALAASQLTAYLNGQLGIGALLDSGSQITVQKGIINSSAFELEGLSGAALAGLLGQEPETPGEE
jgi:hypothetical protein